MEDLTLGFQGNDDWLDMSEWVVHIVGNGPNDSAYWNTLSILYSELLKASGPYGIGEVVDAGNGHKAVCFTDAPLGFLKRIVSGRSPYGLAFSKSTIRNKGGSAIWYVTRDSRAHRAIEALIHNVPGSAAADSLWVELAFVEIVSTWNKYEYEREWRVLGDVTFDASEVAFLLIPERLHAAARAFFDEASAENRGPHYTCPIVDPNWDLERVKSLFAKASAP